MDYWNLIYQVPALFAGTAMIAYLLPWKVDARLVPLLTFIVALVVLALPAFPDVALALVGPTAWLHKVIGVSLISHEPVKLPDVKAIRAKIRPPKVTLLKFAAKAYPHPDDDSEPIAEPDGEAPDEAPDTESPPVLEPSRTVSQRKSYIPPL